MKGTIMKIIVTLFATLLLAPLAVTADAANGPVVLKRTELSKQAKEEANTPIRPGLPGKQPFWNGYARKFMYAPAFDFPSV